MADPDFGYFMESEEEANRLANHHEITKDAMDGELVHAPLNHAAAPLQILDSGTADGTWILDFNEATHGQHHLVGTDIQDKDFPKDNVPKNVEFHVQSINEDWPAKYKDRFDLVHQRLVMVGAGPNWQNALARLADMVKPGGWIQLLEAETTLPPKTETPAWHDFFKAMNTTFSFVGAPLTLADDIPAWLENNGFESVQQERVHARQGRLNPKPELAKRGIYATVVASRGIMQFAKTFPEPPLPLERLENLPQDLKHELTEKGGVMTFRLVYAQKKVK